jgi:hypothetical protein
VIDDAIGKVFEVDIADLNNDGRMDLLVTTNSGRNGTLLAYEIPDDFRCVLFINRMSIFAREISYVGSAFSRTLMETIRLFAGNQN